MNYNKIKEKQELLIKNKDKFSKILLENYTNGFDINFAHDSTAIEGNTLTLMETKLLLEDEISVGSKNLREIYEVVNHNKAWNYVKTLIKSNQDLNEEIVKELHKILMENILPGGIYRNSDVIITGAKSKPPSVMILPFELNNFFERLNNNEFNPLDLAAYTHGEFVRIHPFIDGNGRLSRILMNFQLLKNEFLPISIKNEDKLEYYDALDYYALNNDLKYFKKIIYKLEEKELDFYLNALDLK
ncbi:MAG: Fic family protein [Methanobrevibacter sp.]|nr:Fic family protein [Candidatus Methanoflexus mossambicus]